MLGRTRETQAIREKIGRVRIQDEQHQLQRVVLVELRVFEQLVCTQRRIDRGASQFMQARSSRKRTRGKRTSDESTPIATPTVKEPAKLIVNSSTMLLIVMKETSFADVIVLSALCDVMSGRSILGFVIHICQQQGGRVTAPEEHDGDGVVEDAFAKDRRVEVLVDS
jgi:hypothetical protein